VNVAKLWRAANVPKSIDGVSLVHPMRLMLLPEFLALFPEALVGVAVVRGIDNLGEDPELTARLKTAAGAIPERVGAAPLTEHPRIAVWREAYRRFGAKPKDHPSSIENLLRRAAKGHAPSHINRLVDLYNAVSLEALLPVGAEDLAAIDGDVELTVAGEAEPPVRLLGEPEPRPPKAGEVIYRDRRGAICRRWNWKEADRTKITEATRDAIVVVEGLPPVGRADVEAALDGIARAVRDRFRGTAATALLDASRASLML
jgi:DNA/RNA-binding domain of Phe-tRNA-synthetase-like protein